MRFCVLLLCGFAVGACAPVQQCYGSAVDDCYKPEALAKQRGQLKQLKLYHSDGIVAAEGMGLPRGSPFDPAYWESTPEHDDRPVRSGLWRYYHPNGQKQAVIRTRLSVGVWCGVVAFFAPYDVKEGSFTFYHADGSLLAEGRFEPSSVHRENSCEGGEEIEAGVLPQQTAFYDSSGVVITDTQRLVELREMVERW